MMLFTSQNHPRRQPTTPEVLQKVDLGKALAFYKDRYADAGDFVFVFVGNVDADKLKGMVATYLGSLPTKKRKETWRDVKISLPTGVKTKVVEKGTEPKSSVTMTFHGTETWSRDAENDMRMLVEVMRHRLRQTLREDLGGVYGVQVSGSLVRRPKQEYRLNVSFGCSPENVDKLKQAVLDELAAIQQKGAEEDLLVKIKETRRRSHEIELKDNGFWARELERAYTYADDPKLILDAATMTEKITSDRVRAAANRYAKPSQYVFGVLKPEATP
jgi:zinc protease